MDERIKAAAGVVAGVVMAVTGSIAAAQPAEAYSGCFIRNYGGRAIGGCATLRYNESVAVAINCRNPFTGHTTTRSSGYYKSGNVTASCPIPYYTTAGHTIVKVGTSRHDVVAYFG